MSTPTEDPKKDERPSSPLFVLSDRAANWIIGTVTAIWALNVLAGMVQFNGYEPSDIIHGVFMSVVGTAFLARIKGSG